MSFSQKTYKWGNDRPDFYRSRKTFPGIAPWVGIHAFDWLHWILGDVFTAVQGREGTTAQPDYPACASQAAFVLTMENGGVASVTLDYLRPETAPTHGDERLRIAGTRGVIETALVDHRVTLTPRPTSRRDHCRWIPSPISSRSSPARSATRPRRRSRCTRRAASPRSRSRPSRPPRRGRSSRSASRRTGRGNNPVPGKLSPEQFQAILAAGIYAADEVALEDGQLVAGDRRAGLHRVRRRHGPRRSDQIAHGWTGRDPRVESTAGAGSGDAQLGDARPQRGRTSARADLRGADLSSARSQRPTSARRTSEGCAE